MLDRRFAPASLSRLATCLALALPLLLLAASPRPATAQRAPQLDPVPGAWCGVTDDGGSVQVTITDDGRFVEEVSLFGTKGGSFSSSEGGCATGRAQVADGKWIFRCREASQDTGSPGGSRRCTRAPCRGNGGGSGDGTRPSLIRGFMLNSESMRGNYSAYATRVISSVRGNRTTTKLVLGNYIAWPVGTAPCP